MQNMFWMAKSMHSLQNNVEQVLDGKEDAYTAEEQLFKAE